MTTTESLEQRVARLEHGAENSKGKDFWDMLESASSLLSGIVVLIVGYFLTGTVDKAFEQWRLEVSTGEAVQALVVKLQSPEQGEAEGAAVALASFGRHGVVPLVTALQTPSPNQAAAAAKGLRAASLAAGPDACAALARIVTNRTALYTWQVHRTAIGLLGDLDCRSALPAVQAYARRLEADPDRATWRRSLQNPEDVNEESVGLIQQTLRRSVELLSLPPDA